MITIIFNHRQRLALYCSTGGMQIMALKFLEYRGKNGFHFIVGNQISFIKIALRIFCIVSRINIHSTTGSSHAPPSNVVSTVATW